MVSAEFGAHSLPKKENKIKKLQSKKDLKLTFVCLDTA